MRATPDGTCAVLQACDVGHRVVVRRRVGPRFTDVLGELVAIDEHRLVVRTDDGADLAVALDDVVAAKQVPPRPARYSEIAALELVADRCWYTPDREPLGDWVLRAAQGWTNRANSALPLGDPGRPLAAAVEACRTWYGARGLPAKITVPLPLRRDVARALTGAGWVDQPLVLVQTARVEALAAAPAPGVALLPAPSPDVLRLVAARKQSLPEVALRVLLDAPAVRFAEVRDDEGALLATARGAVHAGWLHLALVEVVEAARRRGLAQAVTRALAAWAEGVGAQRAVLQVEQRNAGAVRLYAGLGFTTHHTYVTYHAAGP